VQEVKQQGVPSRVNQELAVDIIRTKQYQHRDEIPHPRSRCKNQYPSTQQKARDVSEAREAFVTTFPAMLRRVSNN
jgi:hypothetical protein